MKRELASLLVTGAIVLFAFGACDDTEAACKVDTDCPTGNICREGRCGSPTPEGGAPAPDAATTCTSDGLDCSVPDECCSRACTDGKCGTPVPPPEPTCKALYELCQGDECCQGLTCTKGSCR